MRILLLLGLFTAISTVSQAGRISDHASVPPVAEDTGKSLGLDAAVVARTIQGAGPAVFDSFAGQNQALAQEAETTGKAFEVGAGHAVALTPAQLYTRREVTATGFRYSGAVASIDAQALRVQVNLNALAPHERLWLIDPVAQTSFGPYTAADHAPGGRWLPVVEGDMAVLAVDSAEARLPEATVIGLTHFYRGLTGQAGSALAKELSCNIDVACEPNAELQNISSAVGVIVRVSGGYDAAICSGTLLNNDDTEALEPYFMTAGHCLSTQLEVLQIDVIWDFRASACDAGDAPALGTLPRSSGKNLLATDTILDLSLIELDDVPVGTYGRTYAGYNADLPNLLDDVVILSFPEGTAMRIAYGQIADLNVQRFNWDRQYKVDWSLGVTENGSSGGGLFSEDDAYRFIGLLSNGPQHSCVDTSGNIDYCSSFARFYDQAEQWLSGDDPPDGNGGVICPAQTALAASPEALDGLRAFRDKGLALTQTGRAATAAYYWLSPAMVRWVDAKPAHRALFQWLSRPAAKVGAWLD